MILFILTEFQIYFTVFWLKQSGVFGKQTIWYREKACFIDLNIFFIRLPDCSVANFC